MWTVSILKIKIDYNKRSQQCWLNMLVMLHCLVLFESLKLYKQARLFEIKMRFGRTSDRIIALEHRWTCIPVSEVFRINENVWTNSDFWADWNCWDSQVKFILTKLCRIVGMLRNKHSVFGFMKIYKIRKRSQIFNDIM